MGISDGILPAVMDAALIDEIVAVTDEEALARARRLAREGGCLPTSPRAPTWRLARKLSQGKTVVALAPDTDKNYFSTALFEGE